EKLLRARVAELSHGVRMRDGSVVFDAHSAGAWTVDVKRGRATLTVGRARRPTANVYAHVRAMEDVIAGKTPGIQAFLESQLFIRGNIAYPLELDSLFQRDPRAPRIHRADVDGIESFYLEAGLANAPPVLLFHGLGATSASFLPTIWELSRDHRVIAVDL